MKKLAIVVTHPIQYYAPWFAMLQKRGIIQVKAFFTWSQAQHEIFDSGFGQKIEWDIPLTEGYEYEYVQNTSLQPSEKTFKGIENPTLIAKIKEFQPNAILIFGWNFKSHFKVMRYFKNKIPVYMRGDSNLSDEKKSFKTLLRRIALRFVYSYAAKAFYVGTNNKNYYLKHGISEKRLIFAPHSIDNNRFINNKENFQNQANKLRSELGIDESDTVFLYCGKFEAKKDPMKMLDLAKHFYLKKNIKILIVGNGDLEEDLKYSAKGMNNVKFLPFQNQKQIPVIYHLCDVFVFPTKGPYETWGLAVNEAMACGKPIYAGSKSGCAIDLVKNMENGYVFESGNQMNFLKNVDIFLQSDLKKMGEKSLEIIKEWSFENLCKSIENEIVSLK